MAISDELPSAGGVDPASLWGNSHWPRWKAAGQVQQTWKQREASSAARVHVCSWSRGWRVSSVVLQHGIEVIWHFRTVSMASAQFPLEDCCVMTLYYLHTSFGGCKPFLLPHKAFGHLWAQCPVPHPSLPHEIWGIGTHNGWRHGQSSQWWTSVQVTLGEVNSPQPFSKHRTEVIYWKLQRRGISVLQSSRRRSLFLASFQKILVLPDIFNIH